MCITTTRSASLGLMFSGGYAWILVHIANAMAAALPDSYYVNLG